jgi:myo-inositol-1(or 4)-monophosphatase
MQNKDLHILIKAAHAGGEILRKYFGQTLSIVEKSTIADFKTEADTESEQAIIEIIKKELPLYNIISEEDGETSNGSEYTVIIDPLDGTNNFVLGIPHFSVSIGLLYKNEAIAGVVYQPILKQTFSAVKNGGAYLDDKAIKVNDIRDFKKSTIVYTCGYKIDRPYLGKLAGAFFGGNCKRFINIWSAAYEYCMLASGKVESVITDGVEVHDFAAGKLIAKEAGAKIVDFRGAKEENYLSAKFIASSTDEINMEILNIIKPLQDLTS